ncbi:MULTISPECIES: cytidylyltransferase domain-containing protein [unclassified Nocardioides]|uniref:acylneuraminate cytidylyltransferase family protein n=1 Tax=unclassified Nocardioides TaxID=2615069 RepID=UPI0006F2109D|nr:MULTISPECIES: acylneuraminate cytidylyltransferase family protein [unclassified Nocardioides]KQY50249.1 acylneuraminate cytidylyltransferase [Nocardioides sp. Root140]KQZ75874.1 acylneuraminate cytidylyltransferase [Nocardioides sp. Root151]KRF14945.1 acylneuraminate cytidylyltransferase [Nocardioides sp. Soil796]
MIERILAVVPARGGSRGLPGKNLMELGGVPLVGHSIAAARTVPAVRRTLVSTDDEQIAAVSRSLGADVPFLRPAELSSDTAPTGPVIAHALSFAESDEGRPYDAVLLLEPTSPLRDPALLAEAVDLLGSRPETDGVVSVSVPGFDPMSTGVDVDASGTLRRAFPEAAGVTRRQDAGRSFLKLNGNFYLWRADFVRRLEHSWLDEGSFLALEIPESQAFNIDTEYDFRLVEAVVGAGLADLLTTAT